jgi:hypothetical protein
MGNYAEAGSDERRVWGEAYEVVDSVPVIARAKIF